MMSFFPVSTSRSAIANKPHCNMDNLWQNRPVCLSAKSMHVTSLYGTIHFKMLNR